MFEFSFRHGIIYYKDLRIFHQIEKELMLNFRTALPLRSAYWIHFFLFLERSIEIHHRINLEGRNKLGHGGQDRTDLRSVSYF